LLTAVLSLSALGTHPPAKLIELASKGKAQLGPTGTPYYNNTLKAIQIKATSAVNERLQTVQSAGLVKLAQAAANFA
jgi:hypothetical protein